MKCYNKIAGQLARLRAAVPFTIALTLLAACSVDPLALDDCVGGPCSAKMLDSFYKDSNGFYHAPLDWSREYYPYFNIDVVATKPNREYWYNGVPVVEANFDTDTYFILNDSITFTLPLYQPYGGLETYGGFPIPVGNTTVILSQFAGTVVPIVQNDTRVYFSHDEQDVLVSTRRTVGPIPPTLIGDTISVYMKVKWDLGTRILVKDNFVQKFIIE
jgi:hypothetical protein